jgi:hypothetical protein
MTLPNLEFREVVVEKMQKNMKFSDYLRNICYFCTIIKNN